MNVAETLGKISLFKGFSEEHLEKLATITSELQVGNHSEVFREGQDADALFAIVLGSVKVTKKNDEGESEELAILGTGSYVGEMAMVTEGHKRTGTVVAQEPTTLIKIPRTALEELCEADTDFGYHFFYAVARGLSRRLHHSNTDMAHYRNYWRSHHHHDG